MRPLAAQRADRNAQAKASRSWKCDQRASAWTSMLTIRANRYRAAARPRGKVHKTSLCSESRIRNLNPKPGHIGKSSGRSVQKPSSGGWGNVIISVYPFPSVRPSRATPNTNRLRMRREKFLEGFEPNYRSLPRDIRQAWWCLFTSDAWLGGTVPAAPGCLRILLANVLGDISDWHPLVENLDVHTMYCHEL
jgi:hypothetical protein